MKIGLKKSLLVLSAAVFFAACTPVAHKEIGEQRNILSSLDRFQIDPDPECRCAGHIYNNTRSLS